MRMNLDAMGYQETRAAIPGNYETLLPGAYVCRIVNVEDAASKAGNQMLVLYLDIADGEFAGFFRRSFDNIRKYNNKLKWVNLGTYRQLISTREGKTSPFFKGLLTCIENSNNCKFNTTDFDTDDLKGKLCGFMFGEEEYIKQDNSIGTHLAIKYPVAVEDVRTGNFTVPELKKLPAKSQPVDLPPNNKDMDFGGSPIDDRDLPF